MLNPKNSIRSIALILCTALYQHIHAQHDMRYFAGDWHFSIWGDTDISAPPALTGTWYLENGLDSALALVGRVVLNDGANAQGGS